MFLKLQEIAQNQSDYYGYKATWLRMLIEQDIEVLKTVVVTQDFFQSFLLSNKLDKAVIKDLGEFIVHNIGNVPKLFVMVSLFKANTGISNNLIVNNSLSDIEKNIEDIYRSWNDGFARAHRITYGIDEKDTYPTLLIQPYRRKVFSLVTRCPQTGLPTNQNNLKNVHNHVSNFRQQHMAMLAKIEAVLSFPAKVYFSGDLRIYSIKAEQMCDYAYFVCLNDLLRKKQINELEFLSNIQPHFISKVTDVSYLPVDGTEYIQLRGVPGAPGRAIGALTFNLEDSFTKYAHSYRVCCFAVFRPGDLHYLLESVGAFTNEGGATSHLAVVSRQFGIPSIVGISSLRIDLERKQVRNNSKVFGEGSWVMIDGYTGIITLSAKPFSVEPTLTYSTTLDNENLQQLYFILNKYTGDFNTFGKLPIDLQLHMSKLTQRLKTIGFQVG